MRSADLPPTRLQRGQAALEAAIVLPVLVLAGLSAIELARWLFLRQALSLALLDAGRAAIVHHLHPGILADAFEQALLPLYSGANPQRARDADLALRQTALRAPPWRIEILSPSDLAFRRHADPTLRLTGAAAGLPVINHHYQAERAALQTPDLYEANTLVLRLIYPLRPLLPPLHWLLRGLGNDEGDYSQRALAQGHLPLVRQLALVMHSHPVQWPLPPDGRIVRAAGGPATGIVRPAGPAGPAALPGPSGSGPQTPSAASPPQIPVRPFPGTEPVADHAPVQSQPDATPLPPGTDDQALCGIALCCR